MKLSGEEKRILLEAARRSIESQFRKTGTIAVDYEKIPILKTKCGAFVTITIHENLRGCIGYIISEKKLFDTVRDAAVQAAIYDPRFPSLTEQEFENIRIEISVLSEPFPMKSYDEIEIGTHGLILDENGRRGLLLPQVPMEHNMNKEEYLSALCRKAGIAANAWKEKILNISMFTATVFDEDTLNNPE